MSGFIKLHRKITEWEWYNDIKTTRLFMHLLLKANYQDKKWQGILIRRGSLVTSYPTLERETGLTNQSIRTSLKKLKKSKDITVKVTNKYQIISVVSYCNYQDCNSQVTDNQQTTNSQLTDKQQSNNRQLTATKEREESKEVLEKDNLTVIQKETPKDSKKSKGSRFEAKRDLNDKAIIPDNFHEYAITQGLSEQEIDHHFQVFADHWKSTSGQKGVKLDWLATWRNWLRNTYSRKYSSPKADTSVALKDITSFVNSNPMAHERPTSAYQLEE